MMLLARAAVCMLISYAALTGPIGTAAAETAEAAKAGPPMSDRGGVGDVRDLERDLGAWQRCHALELLIPAWQCERTEPDPISTRSLGATLRSFSALDAVTAHQRASGERSGAISRCLLGVSSNVRSILRDRASQIRLGLGPSFWRRMVGPSRWIEWLCDGVDVPDWLDAHRMLGRHGLCAYTVDEATGIDGAGLRRCIETIAASRLASAGVGPRLPRPNVIVILTDDQRWDSIDGTHGPSPQLGLPAMPTTFGRLAGEGITFTQAVVTTPICGPSRGSFFTGLYMHRHGMVANGGKLGARRFEDGDTWATRLDAAGYRTGFVGKYTNGFSDLWSHGVDEPYIPPGWDDFKVFDDTHGVAQTRFSMIENGVTVSYDTEDPPYSSDVLARHALAFIDAAAASPSEAPFALWVSTTAPHYPLEPAARHRGSFNRLRFVRYPSTFEEDVSDKPPWIRSRAVPRSFETGVALNQRRRQLEMLLSVDDMVAAILDRLEVHGMGDDTIIVYTSDNGQAWGEHRWDSKSCPWEECLRVPMLVRYPRLVPGPRSEGGLVSSVDLLPTLLGLVDADAPGDVDGIDLAEVVRGFEAVPERDVLFETYVGYERSYTGIRRDGLKYFRYVDGAEVLHDLDADPWELENFVERPEYALVREQMSARLRELRPGH